MSSNKEFFKKIDSVLEKAPENRHSYYQLKYFVLGKEPTTQGQLWQCLRELQSRKETIDNIHLQIADTKDEIELTEIELSNNKEVCEQKQYIILRKLKRKKESLSGNLEKLEKTLKFVTQEARFFLQAFEALQEIEPLKDYDDLEAQQEFWEAKISEEINLRVLTKQALPSDLLKTALSLHDNSKIKEQIINLIAFEKEKSVRKQINNK